MSNEIPPMTNPLGRHWEQPDVKDIEIDDTHALMTNEALLKLKEYNFAPPTGIYEGKMWKSKVMGVLVLKWYGFAEGDFDFCPINIREIIHD